MKFAISGNAVPISGINAAAINAAISVVNLVHNSQIRRERADCRSAICGENHHSSQFRRRLQFNRGAINMFSKIWAGGQLAIVPLQGDRKRHRWWSVVPIFRTSPPSTRPAPPAPAPPCLICFWSCLAGARHQFTCVQLSCAPLIHHTPLCSSHFLFLQLKHVKSNFC